MRNIFLFLLVFSLLGCGPRKAPEDGTILEIWEYGSFDPHPPHGKGGDNFPQFSQVVFYRSGEFKQIYGLIGRGLSPFAEPCGYMTYSGSWKLNGIESTLSRCRVNLDGNDPRDVKIPSVHKLVYSLRSQADSRLGKPLTNTDLFAMPPDRP
jgi:hypothetical protein